MAGITDPSEPDLTQNLTGFDSAVHRGTPVQSPLAIKCCCPTPATAEFPAGRTPSLSDVTCHRAASEKMDSHRQTDSQALVW